MDSSVLAVKGDALAAVPKSDQLSSTSAAMFKVLGLPLGRVALQPLVDDRLVTVTGLGEASGVCKRTLITAYASRGEHGISPGLASLGRKRRPWAPKKPPETA